ncbi:MAG: hypothetical protein KGY75_01705 [Candidatus Cloacimonetes bacterium]|nr:hypothetical protein [Candidatus Cloacimonadota bacterium]MBS3766826.1 hypothetical protein [Candidatus Cloacimonadota bacterium]
MKKILLITLSLLLLSSVLFASEFSSYFSSKRIAKGSGSERYWHLRDIYLDWSYKEFATALNITELTANPPKLNIDEAWVKFNVLTTYFSPLQRYEWFILNMQVGKVYYPFGNTTPYASQNISIFQPPTFDSSWMLNLEGKYCSRYHFNLYWSDPGQNGSDQPSTIGARAQVDIGDFQIGASYRARDWTDLGSFNWDDVEYEDYSVDVIWQPKDMFKFNAQLYNLDDTDVSTNDLNYFLIASYEKGFMLPFFKKTKPYVGYFSKDDFATQESAKESNIIVGMNMEPHDNIFMKVEYNYDTVDKEDPNVLTKHNLNVSNALSFEFGLVF